MRQSHKYYPDLTFVHASIELLATKYLKSYIMNSLLNSRFLCLNGISYLFIILLLMYQAEQSNIILSTLVDKQNWGALDFCTWLGGRRSWAVLCVSVRVCIASVCRDCETMVLSWSQLVYPLFTGRPVSSNLAAWTWPECSCKTVNWLQSLDQPQFYNIK